ncbi:MAG TPA: hypothetical protein VFV10_13920, partial [Gammaproteobacteria bacterium]|nr:hypothetical protein [Gammaproteobacteria bacterium]
MPLSRKSLAPSPREAPLSAQPAVSPARPHLWLAVRLPALALESVAERAHSALARASVRPLAVVEPRRGRLCVVAVDDAARACGIEPG